MKKESFTEQALKGSFWNTLFSIVQRIGGVIFTIILARVLLPEKFGLYNLVISVALIFLTFSGGINDSIIRYVSSVVSKNKASSYFKYISKIKMLVASISILFLLVLSYPLAFYVFHKPIIFVSLILSAVYITFVSVENLFTSAFFAIKKVNFVVYREIAYQLSRIIIVVLLSFLYLSIEVSHILIALILSALVSLTFVLYQIKKNAGYLMKNIFNFKNELNIKDKSKVLKFFFYSTTGAISFIFFGYIDAIMIGMLISDASYVGFYRAAFILPSSIGGLLTFTWILMPIFMKIKEQKLENAFNKVLKYSMIIAVPASFGLASLGNYFLVLIYGYGYLNATLPLYFLSALIFIGVIASLLLNLFSVKGKPDEYLPLLIITIVLNIVLNYILITWLSKYSLLWGISGAAIATMISWLVYCFLLYAKTKKNLKLNPDLKTIIKPAIASIIMIFFIYITRNTLGDANLIKGIILVAVGVISYIISLFLIKGMVKEDFFIIRQIILSNKSSKD